jgi:peptide/nickel transport system substrate-binding protein
MFRRLAVLTLAILASTAQGATLTMGLANDITSMDPHFHNVTPNASVAEHLFNTLVAKDSAMHLLPSLALSWKAVDDLTWEIKLRRGVKFHDGSEFTAEDAIFSLSRPATIKNSPSPYTIYTKAIAQATAVDKYTMRIKTAFIDPNLPNELSTIYIVSKKAAENAGSDEFNSGRAAVGTGPFKFVAYKKGDRIELARHDAYWGAKPEWDKVTLRMLTSDPARVAALLAGDVQAIEAVPTADQKSLKANPKVAVFSATTFRMMFLHLDSARDVSPFVTDKAGKPLAKNPLKDVRVRQAISKAISRTAIADRIMEGAAEPTGQLVLKTLFGYNPAIKADIYDPNAARKLLADAGYPDGFGLTIHSPNNRYTNDEKVAQVVAQQLARIGIATKVETMPSSVFFSRASKLDFSFYLAGWGADTGEAGSTLKALLATYDVDKGWGTANRGRYSNAAVDDKISKAFNTIDDGKREKLLQEATEIALTDYGIIPLYNQNGTWALKKGLTISPRVDERFLAAEIHAK